MKTLLSERGERAVAAGEDRVAIKRHELGAVVLVLLAEVRGTAAHGAGKDGVTYDSEGPTKASDDVGGHTERVAEGEESFDGEFAEVEMGVLLKCLRAGGVGGFEFARPDRGAGGGDEFRKIRDVVVVGMGKEYRADAEFLGGDEAEHIVAVGAGIENGSFFGAGIPDEVAINRHILERSVKHGKASLKERLLRIPRTMGQGL